MDMHAAYREVGSYRAAAEICGTTPKTVKRSVLAAQAAETGEMPAVAHNYDAVRDLVIERVERTKGKISAKRLLAGGPSGRLRRIGTQLAPAGRRGQGRVAGHEPPWSSSGRLGAG